MSMPHNITSLQEVANSRNHVIVSTENYKNVKSRITVHCKTCRFNWQPTAHSYLSAKKTGCVSCKKQIASLTHRNKIVAENTRFLIGSKASQRQGSLKGVTGSDHPRYNGGYGRDFKKPSNFDYAWKTAVRKLYRNKCALTLSTTSKCHAHHLNSYNMFPEQRYLVENGVYLSKEVHKHFHDIYKYGNNTELQFIEFCKTYYRIDWIALKNKTISSQALKF